MLSVQSPCHTGGPPNPSEQCLYRIISNASHHLPLPVLPAQPPLSPSHPSLLPGPHLQVPHHLLGLPQLLLLIRIRTSADVLLHEVTRVARETFIKSFETHIQEAKLIRRGERGFHGGHCVGDETLYWGRGAIEFRRGRDVVLVVSLVVAAACFVALMLLLLPHFLVLVFLGVTTCHPS
jgi:hypothetical protein